MTDSLDTKCSVSPANPGCYPIEIAAGSTYYKYSLHSIQVRGSGSTHIKAQFDAQKNLIDNFNTHHAKQGLEFAYPVKIGFADLQHQNGVFHVEAFFAPLEGDPFNQVGYFPHPPVLFKVLLPRSC